MRNLMGGMPQLVLVQLHVLAAFHRITQDDRRCEPKACAILMLYIFTRRIHRILKL